MAELAGLVAVTGTDPPEETPPARRSRGVLEGVKGDPLTTTVASRVFFRVDDAAAVSPEGSRGGNAVGVDESGDEGIQNRVTFGPDVLFFGGAWRSSPEIGFAGATVGAAGASPELSEGSAVTTLLGTAPSSPWLSTLGDALVSKIVSATGLELEPPSSDGPP